MKGIVSLAWLNDHLASSEVVIVDCRFLLSDPDAGEQAYRESHIPGAHYADLERDLSAPKQPDVRGGRHPLPDTDRIEAVFTRIGIQPGDHVIAYDDQGGAMAARLWWLLRWSGHEGEVSILDGGFGGWKEAGYPVSTELPPTGNEAAPYVARIQDEMVVSQAEVLQRLHRSGTVLIDSREAPRYRGESEPIDPVAGHIPGAVNRFWKDSLTEEGSFKSAEQQRERFADLSPDDELIVYCGSGVTACPNVFALEAAGFRNVKLYAGSWSDWVSNSENPVATGEEEKA